MTKQKPKKSQLLVTLILGIAIGYFVNKATNNSDIKNNLGHQDNFSIVDYEASKHSISLKETVKLYNNYRRRFIKPITNIQLNTNVQRENNFYEPTEFLYMDLKAMKNYMAFLEYVETQNSNQPISGIAINFGAYSLNKQSKDGDYRGRLSVFLTPTFKKNNEHVPFYINYTDASNTYKGEYKPLEDLYNGMSFSETKIKSDNTQQNLIQTTISGQQSLSYNEFNARPPRRNDD